MMTEMAKSREAMARNVVALSGRVRRFMKWNLSMFPLKENKSILDLGSGPGMYFAEIMAYSPSFYLAADNNPNALGNLVKLMTDKPDCRVINLDLMDQKAISDLQGLQFDYVLCLDVIEHIDDDRMALINIRRILELTGRGTLFLRVPAISFIYG
jgi:2-polyprenyl-3-methyl-5-hydroxy-6-metoxy-1,4-benzoquinol methylase